ncbi:MAG: HlyD family efflux transporter periplasmic adaptor subunit [Candidatus Peregrinibacteria bacterium]|nr:HlyD family efflux transporter periplasmic adaptor subunit [Candidatus Peregrinibacteria bacterium]
MKLSSYAFLCGIVLLFLLFQGWILLDRFWFPKQMASNDAVLMRTILDVGTPVVGTVQKVYVLENQPVKRNAMLFEVTAQTQVDPKGVMVVPIRSPREGIVMDIGVAAGEFVQASEILAKVVDGDADAQYVTARFTVSPQERFQMKPFLPATVIADHLNDGEPMPALVTSVSPFYDSVTRSVEVRLRLLKPLDPDGLLSVGLPVTVEISVANENAFKDWVKRVAKRFAPSSLAEPL